MDAVPDLVRIAKIAEHLPWYFYILCICHATRCHDKMDNSCFQCTTLLGISQEIQKSVQKELESADYFVIGGDVQIGFPTSCSKM